jgi:hypothetical protein
MVGGLEISDGKEAKNANTTSGRTGVAQSSRVEKTKASGATVTWPIWARSRTWSRWRRKQRDACLSQRPGPVGVALDCLPEGAGDDGVVLADG